MAIFYLLPQQSGNGYVSYSPVNNQYGTKQTIETIMQIAGDYFRNQQIQIQIGDMSYEKGAPMPPHHTHTDGKCVDIRPIRKDKKLMPVNFHQDTYDRSATELLVQALLSHKNVKKILFNDTNIKGVHWFQGHDNHLHVTFYH